MLPLLDCRQNLWSRRGGTFADCWHFRDGLDACREHLLSDGGDVQSMSHNWSKGYSSLWCWSVSHSEKRSFLCEAATVCAFLSVFICSSAVPCVFHCHSLHYSLPLFSQSPYVQMINYASVCTLAGGFLDWLFDNIVRLRDHFIYHLNF